MSQELADSLPLIPVNGYVLSYWSTYDNHLSCIRMIYYENTKWTNHPWSKAYVPNTGGADFEDEWAVETSSDGQEFHPTSRATGWDIRAHRLLPAHAHVTRKEASQYLYQKLESKIQGLEDQARELRAQQSELSADVFG